MSALDASSKYFSLNLQDFKFLQEKSLRPISFFWQSIGLTLSKKLSTLPSEHLKSRSTNIVVGWMNSCISSWVLKMYPGEAKTFMAYLVGILFSMS